MEEVEEEKEEGKSKWKRRGRGNVEGEEKDYYIKLRRSRRLIWLCTESGWTAASYSDHAQQGKISCIQGVISAPYNNHAG